MAVVPGSVGAYLKLDSDGSGTIITGAQECGTGSVMALPILAAEVLGMRPEEFRIVYQDTGVAPYDGGASGSQTTFNNGRAVIAAATEIRDQLIVLAAGMLEANPRDIELVDGMARVKGSHTAAVPLGISPRRPRRGSAPGPRLRPGAADSEGRRSIVLSAG